MRVFWIMALPKSCVRPWSVGYQGHSISSDSSASCVYHIWPGWGMLLHFCGCSPLLWSRLWFHSYMVARSDWLSLFCTLAVIVVLLLFLDIFNSGLDILHVVCFMLQWARAIGRLFLACVPWRAEMGTGQSLELGWLCILAVLSPCLHFFSTMTSPFSRLL